MEPAEGQASQSGSTARTSRVSGNNGARRSSSALGLIVLIIVLKIYSGIVSTIDNLPVDSGLLELTGLIWLINFPLRNMIRSADRKNVISALQSRWSSITGR